MRLKCYRSTSAQRRSGGLHGIGLFAIKNIAQYELIAIKAGKLVDESVIIKFSDIINGSHHQIGSNLFMTGLTRAEVDSTLIGYNHSCSPNAYVFGQIELRAMRDIETGEER